MKVVVLGASGFLGRAICEELRNQGIFTVAVSRRPFSSQSANKTIVVEDYSKLPQELNGTACIHLATPGSLNGVSRHQFDDLLHEATNTVGSLVRFGFSKIVFASSAAVYGDKLTRPAVESDATDSSSPYARLKIECEGLLRPETDIVARVANVYGSGMSSLNVLSDILNQIPSEVGSVVQFKLRALSPVRDYIAAKDVARAFAKLATRPLSGIYNLGSGVPRTVAEVATLLLQAAKIPQPSVVATNEIDHPSYLVLNSQRALRDLPWHSECDIQQEFQELVREYKKRENP